MGKKDTITKNYMKENRVFADAFNYLLYNGQQMIQPEKLREIDTTEMAIRNIRIRKRYKNIGIY